MHNITIRQRIRSLFLRPRQIIVLDGESGKPATNIKISLGRFLLLCLLLTLALLWGGYQFKESNGNTRSLMPQYMQLQRQYDDIQKQLIEARAFDELKTQELESLKQELLSIEQKNIRLSQRLRMFENILEARKAAGIHLLEPEIKWAENRTLQYNFTLVKGGSYPRHISGAITLTALSPEHEAVEIPLGKDKAALPFRIETHTFLRGSAVWEYDWNPDKLVAVISNRRGKQLLQQDIMIQGVAK